MIVTKENFAEIYPELRSRINNALFIAIDEEMTGIFDRSNRNRKNDDPAARYMRMIPVASRYSIIQVGLSIFMHAKSQSETEDGMVVEDTSNEYVVYPYTFYIFPEPYCASDVVLSPSSIDFLNKNNMDWMKWICKGISFVNGEEEMVLRKKYDQDSNNNNPNVDVASVVAEQAPQQQRIVLQKPWDIEFMTKNMDGFNKMLLDPAIKDFEFDKCNAFLMKYIHQTLENDHRNVCVKKNNDGKLVASKVSEEEKAAFDIIHKKERKKAFEDALGFRMVFNDLVQCKKPLVGHNCFFDLLFLMKWLDGPLPSDMSLFVGKFNKMFPEVYDTKYIAASGILGISYQDTALCDIYDQLLGKKFTASNCSDENIINNALEALNSVKIVCGNGFDNYKSTESQQLHDAGYDSYCTGCVLAAEIAIAKGFNIIKQNAVNKLFMMQSLYHMDIDPVAAPTFGTLKYDGIVLHVHGFSEKTTTDDLIKLAVTTGVDKSMIEIIWIDGNSALACFQCTDTHDDIINKVDQELVKEMNVVLDCYPPVQLEVKNSTADSLLTKRKIDEDETDIGTRQKV